MKLDYPIEISSSS